jgi:hypothetical protein
MARTDFDGRIAARVAVAGGGAKSQCAARKSIHGICTVYRDICGIS